MSDKDYSKLDLQLLIVDASDDAEEPTALRGAVISHGMWERFLDDVCKMATTRYGGIAFGCA